MGLAVITGSNPTRINDIYEKLVTNIQTLESIGKKKDIGGYVRLALAKLSGIRADLVRLADNWQEWRFQQLVEALKKMGARGTRSPWFATLGDVTRRETYKHRGFVYCKSTEHKSVDCDKIKGGADRRRYLLDRKMCFDRTGTRHRSVE